MNTSSSAVEDARRQCIDGGSRYEIPVGGKMTFNPQGCRYVNKCVGGCAFEPVDDWQRRLRREWSTFE